MIPLLELGGAGQVVHLAPANGFPLGCYQPIATALASRYRIVALPPKALWPKSPSPPEMPGRWGDLARDLAAGFAEHRLDRVIAIGHSFGGVASLLAAGLPGSAIAGLVLLDPTLLEPEVFAAMEAGRRAARPDWHPLVARTLARRDRFASREEALRYFRGRPAFADWPDQSVALLVEDGLVPNGDGFKLKWSPAWEAHYYQSIDTETWEAVATLDAALPTLVLGGAQSDTFTARCRAMFAERAPRAEITTIPGGHLFPLSAPDRTAAAIRGWLERTFEETP
ncbi:MAG: alpha/beta hydrolase [Gemmatimonadetes bacterium]|nr:alpha/beta hydrolase [Gemmatimonadota bacterium]